MCSPGYPFKRWFLRSGAALLTSCVISFAILFLCSVVGDDADVQFFGDDEDDARMPSLAGTLDIASSNAVFGLPVESSSRMQYEDQITDPDGDDQLLVLDAT